MEPINIVIEGCDRVGKTTLANLIADVYQGEVIHIPFKSTAENPHQQKMDMRKLNTDLVRQCVSQEPPRLRIYDRFIYGEHVYGHLRGYESDYLFTDEWVLPNNIILIVVDADLRVLSNRFDDKTQNVENVPLFLDRFRDVYRRAPVKNKLCLFNDFRPQYFGLSLNLIDNLWGHLLNG